MDSAAEVFETPDGAGVSVVARDPATQLAVFRVPAVDAPPLTPWSPGRLQDPRFLIAADVSRTGTSLRPVFVGALYPTVSPFWPESIWAVPERTDLQPGTFVFTVDGALAGLVTEREGRPVIVPGNTVLAAVDRLLQEGDRKPGWLGIQVQPLTPDIASAIGASTGVIVAWIEPRGPAAGHLAIADVIEQIDGDPVVTAEYWNARVAGLSEGDAVMLNVRRRNDVREVRLTAGRPQAPADDLPLGLTMRAINAGWGRDSPCRPEIRRARALVSRRETASGSSVTSRPLLPRRSRACSAPPRRIARLSRQSSAATRITSWCSRRNGDLVRQ